MFLFVGQAGFSAIYVFLEITTQNHTICDNVQAMKEKRIKPSGRRDTYFSPSSLSPTPFSISLTKKSCLQEPLEMKNLIFNHKKISL